MKETWVPIVKGYEVSSRGRVRSLWRKKPHVLKPVPDGRGYLRVSLSGKWHRIHNLVLTAFVGPRPKGAVGMHLDGNPRNNRLENLMWGSWSENQTGVGGRKLSESDVANIITMIDVGRKDREIAALFGVSIQHIQHIRTGRKWVKVRQNGATSRSAQRVA